MASCESRLSVLSRYFDVFQLVKTTHLDSILRELLVLFLELIDGLCRVHARLTNVALQDDMSLLHGVCVVELDSADHRWKLLPCIR